MKNKIKLPACAKKKILPTFSNFEVAALPTYKQSWSLDRVIFIFFTYMLTWKYFMHLCFNIHIRINWIILCLEISAKEIILKNEKFSGIRANPNLSLW